ncbi:kinesin-like protein Klp5 [Schizosaccharomyces cryophilus OY26]|uniref:Kinesin-like protein n=1 Tax=Schizosaccharomyces cryophilus (strain OY26 / ATCC MYA-4695 / CBS 11777 / NBRC 106824 / NRRL Y48691) TaxID=653667 RepID=S9W4W7_SCHCR|nr:kinesin-like protein Klp5 [Schizosaccharomyces cryophilus OY26]EPY52965.1 kinesin-like protein Klp5 [Schizosaccharomyces cryophilus OY26]
MSRQSSISVAVRVRPFSTIESANLLASSDGQSLASSLSFKNPGVCRGIRRVVKVLDDRVLVFDPPDDASSMHAGGRRMSAPQRNISRLSGRKGNFTGFGRDLRYAFDRVFDETASQQAVYEQTARPLLDNILDGFNSTVFAYGATGCGKTHTITGTKEDPGIVYLTLKELFERMDDLRDEKIFSIYVSYLEIYNETIRDLLTEQPFAQSKPLTLREDADRRITVPGLTSLSPTSLEELMEIVARGNGNRTMSPTAANVASSRSHAVLQVSLVQKPRTAGINEDHALATLSVIDLAGSERANATKNRGGRLLEGANINKSLLALGNCINALCDPHRRAHIPYRDSKLTRLLKFSLGGNCKTVMIVCISPSSFHYEETHNTLKYANRAKNIKTEVLRNMISVDRHVSQYVKAIVDLRQQIAELDSRLANPASSASVAATAKNQAAAQAKACESKLMEAKDLLRATFLETLPLQKDTIGKVEKVKHYDDSINILKYWISSCERIADSSSSERLLLAKSKLESLLIQRSAIIADVNPEKVYDAFQKSVDPVVSYFKENNAMMYADILQDEIDLLKSIIENQILDAQSKVDDYTPVLQKLMEISFKSLTQSKQKNQAVLSSLLKTWLSDLGSKDKHSMYQLYHMEDYDKARQRLAKETSIPTYSSSSPSKLPKISNSPRRFTVKSPKKPVVFPKRSPKKRVRFDDSMSTSDSSVSAYNSPEQSHSKNIPWSIENMPPPPSFPLTISSKGNTLDLTEALDSPQSSLLEDKPEDEEDKTVELDESLPNNLEPLSTSNLDVEMANIFGAESSNEEVSLPHLDTIDLDASPISSTNKVEGEKPSFDQHQTLQKDPSQTPATLNSNDVNLPTGNNHQNLSSLTSLRLSNPSNIRRSFLVTKDSQKTNE